MQLQEQFQEQEQIQGQEVEATENSWDVRPGPQ